MTVLPVCVSAASVGCVFAGSTALDLQNIERSRRCGGRLAEVVPGAPMLRNRGGGGRLEEGLEIPTFLSMLLCILLIYSLLKGGESDQKDLMQVEEAEA